MNKETKKPKKPKKETKQVSVNDIWCHCGVNSDSFNDVYYVETDGPLGHCWCCGNCDGLVQVG